MLWLFLTLLFLILAVWIFIHTSFGQNWLTHQITRRLSKELQTKVSIQHVDFSLFNKMHLEGVLLEDRQRDTLLYAGDLQVKVTDWFFVKDNVVLKHVALEDALIKFQRTDSLWSQQFLLDYFSSPSTPQKKESGFQIDLKTVELKNVRFLKKDAWLGEDMTIKVGSLDMDANSINLTGNVYDINTLAVKNPVVSLYSYQGIKPETPDSPGNIRNMTDTSLIWNDAGTIVKLGNLKIENGTFQSNKQTARGPYPWFDGEHILFNQINGSISHARFVGDTIFSNLKLTAKERSGFEVKNLQADLKFTPQSMIFNNLAIKTNKSTIHNFFMMSYNDLSDMDDFIHKVNMAGNFDNSEIDSDDIAFFAPDLKNWKKKILLKGKVRGPVDALVGKEMSIMAGNSTVLNGDISLTGLPDINETFIDFKANNFKTTYSDAATIVPAIREITNPDLRKIQYLNFKGNFTGFIRDFVTFGTIQTNLGTITSDLNMKLPRGQEPLYSGKIATDNFRLGEFLGDKNIGSVALTGTLKGRGFSEKTRNTLLDGTIRYADYNNYRYSNITIKGKIDKKLFDGEASINDPNADISLNGVIDFNSETPKFDLMAEVRHSNLKNLKLTNDSLTFKGKLNFDFTSSSIDNFLGNARITESEITKNGFRLPFDSLIVSSTFKDSIKTLTAVSNEFKASVTGDFVIKDLPDAFTYLLNKYYPAYIKAPATYPRNKKINFDIRTFYVDDYIKLIDSNMSGFNASHIYGDLNLGDNTIDLHADVPQFKYKQYNFDSIQVSANGTGDNLALTGVARNIKINDSLNIPTTFFQINAHNDSSRVKIFTGANQAVERANINALVLTYNDGVKIEFDPSTFAVNGKIWSIEENGELVFRSTNPASGQLTLHEGEQKIMLKTQPSSTGKWNDLNAELVKVNLGDISPLFLPKNRLEGLVSGHVLVEDPTNNLRISSDDIETAFLRLDNDSLGAVKASAVYDNKNKELKAKGNTRNQENYLGFDADIFFDPLKAKDNIIALKANNFQLKILERFLGDLFTDIQGFLTGDINIKGEFDNLSVIGKGRLKNAGLKVIFTQCYYKIQDTDVELTQNEINLDGIVITDTVTRNPIYLTGNIQHEAFRNMFYDLYISTRKPNTTGEANNRPVLLLNTAYKDNKQFYGRVKGTGSLSLTGPESEMFMKVDAIASNKDSSNITIPPSQNRESGIADFLVERKYGHEMSDSNLKKESSNIIYDVDITATPLINVKVVLDELTGDEIKGKGSGTLNIHSGTSEPLSIRGRYDIDEGSYLFTFQSFFKKPFELKKGANNYIEWNGDPYKANIHFDAQYRAERVNFSSLGITSLDNNVSKARGDVYVIATLTDELFKPTIQFALDFPASSPAITDPSLALIFQQMQKDANELNKQVTYLIVFNSFAPSGDNNTIGAGIGINTISGIFLNVISDQFNKLLGSLFKNDKYRISVNTSIYNRNLIDPSNNTAINLGSNVNFSVGRSLFNDRFIITAGGGFDAPLQQQSSIQQSIPFLPDVTLEWLINQTGTIRASFFYRENTDYLTTSVTPGVAKRLGGSLTYRKDFDKLGDLFKRKKKKNAPLPVKENAEATKEKETP